MIRLALTRDIGQEFILRPGNSIISRYPALENLGTLVSTVLPNALIIAGLVGFFLLLLAGIAYIVNAGKGNPEGIAKVLKWINSILIGLIIIFVSYWLVRIVQVISGVGILGP